MSAKTINLLIFLTTSFKLAVDQRKSKRGNAYSQCELISLTVQYKTHQRLICAEILMLEIEFLVDFVPVLLGHIAIPPLSYLDGTEDVFSPMNGALSELLEILYRMIPFELLDGVWVRRNMLLQMEAPTDARMKQALGHQIVHHNYQHLRTSNSAI